jgi:hypothetical protein
MRRYLPILLLALVWAGLAAWREAGLRHLHAAEVHRHEVRSAPDPHALGPSTKAEPRAEVGPAPWTAGTWLTHVPLGVFHGLPAAAMILLFLLARRPTTAEEAWTAGG